NLSLGTHVGPHDGTSAFETALNALTGPGRIIIKSAGNEGQQRIHADVLAGDPGTEGRVMWRIAGGIISDVAANGYYNSPAEMDVLITPPNDPFPSQTIGPVSLGGESAPPPGVSTPYGSVYIANRATSPREVYLEIQGNGSDTPTGDWII